MSDELDRYTRISEGFDTRVRAVRPEQWDLSTPCEEWNVRALVTHLIGAHHWMLSTLGQTHDTPGENDDLVAAWTTARQDVMNALADDTVASQEVDSPFGKRTFAEMAGGLLCGDTLFHTWDLARATGQDETLDEAACARALAEMEPMDQGMRRSGMFGPAIDPPADADVQTRLLCFGGRRP